LFAHHHDTQWNNYSKHSIEPELLLLKHLLEPESTFIDVGANKGEFVLWAEKKIARQNIYCFEPLHNYHNRLTQLFPGIRAINCALSDKAGTAMLKIPYLNGIQDYTLSTMRTTYVAPHETSSRQVEIPTIPLDQYLEENPPGHPVRLIKIDVEGHELSVLKGAEATITNHRPMLMVEIMQLHHSRPINTIIQNLCNMRYTCTWFNTNINRLVPVGNDYLPPEDTTDYPNNFLFIPLQEKDADQWLNNINREIADSTAIHG